MLPHLGRTQENNCRSRLCPPKNIYGRSNLGWFQELAILASMPQRTGNICAKISNYFGYLTGAAHCSQSSDVFPVLYFWIMLMATPLRVSFTILVPTSNLFSIKHCCKKSGLHPVRYSTSSRVYGSCESSSCFFHHTSISFYSMN